MVVEDEAMIRKGIVNSIPWSELGFNVVSESKNGQDALEKLKKNPVDVLLTDIKMPIMDGVELAKAARQLYPDIEIIVLSGFADFEYARQAINFRASSYLLKPTNKKKLLDAFKELKENMDEKRERREDIFHKSAYINVGYETKRKEFLQAIIDGETRIFNDFDEKTNALELDFTGQFVCAAIIKFDRKTIFKELSSSSDSGKRMLEISYRNIIEELLDHVNNGYYIIEDYDAIHFIFCFDSKEQQDALMIPTLENVCENIQIRLFKHVKLPYVIGIGLSYPSVHSISKSFAQASKSIQNNFYTSDQNVLIFEDNNDSKYEQNYAQFYPEQMEGVALAVSNGNYKDVEKLLTAMFKNLRKQKILPEIVKNYCIALKFMVRGKMPDTYEVAERVVGKDYSEFVKNALTVKELESYVIYIMVTLAREIDKTFDIGSANEQYVMIEKAKQYMKKHLSEKITLKMISEHVYLSDTYFSFLFKKVVGITYMDYIQKLRMKEAKRLLLGTTYKIYEVAEMIGYNDYKYFSVQFKKYVSMTPKEYRKQGLKEEHND